MTTQSSSHLAAYPSSPPTGDPGAYPALSWSPTRSTWPPPNHLLRRRPSPIRPLRWPSGPSPASTAGFRPGQPTDRPWTRRATMPTGHPSRGAACPTGTLHHLPAGHSGRGNPRTGHPRWTPDAGHPDAQTSVPDTGQRSRDAGRSHQTPDADRGHWHADEGTAGLRTSGPRRL